MAKVYNEFFYIMKKDELQGKLNTLKNNLEKAGLQVLLEQYAAGYHQLCRDIKALWGEVMDSAATYISVRKELAESKEFRKKLKAFQKEIDKALYEQCDLEIAINLYEQYKLDVWNEFRDGQCLYCYKLRPEDLV